MCFFSMRVFYIQVCFEEDVEGARWAVGKTCCLIQVFL